MRKTILAVLVLAACPLFAAPETFVIDKSHSSVEFRIKHMMSIVAGRFVEYSGSINADRDTPANSSVEFTIQTASINTHTADRDKHLRSADFFDVEKYPTITFKSVKVVPTSTKDTYDVLGDLTMHGVTKRIKLPVVFNGFGKDPQGMERAGFSIETKLNRNDYGIVWNKALNPGGVLLGDDVTVEIEIEAVKK